MPIENLKHIKYTDLNTKQKERYNFHKIAALLADYGFSSIKLDDDWHGTDFIAVHIDGLTTLKVQLKGRLSFFKKYEKKGIDIAFPYHDSWYLYDHDELQEIFQLNIPGQWAESESWQKGEGYSWNKLSPKILKILEPYKLLPKGNSVEIDD